MITPFWGRRKGRKQGSLSQLLLSDQPWPLLPMPYCFLSTVDWAFWPQYNLVDFSQLARDSPSPDSQLTIKPEVLPSASPNPSCCPVPSGSRKMGSSCPALLLASVRRQGPFVSGLGFQSRSPGLWVEMVGSRIKREEVTLADEAETSVSPTRGLAGEAPGIGRGLLPHPWAASEPSKSGLSHPKVCFYSGLVRLRCWEQEPGCTGPALLRPEQSRPWVSQFSHLYSDWLDCLVLKVYRMDSACGVVKGNRRSQDMAGRERKAALCNSCGT